MILSLIKNGIVRRVMLLMPCMKGKCSNMRPEHTRITAHLTLCVSKMNYCKIMVM